LTHDEMETSIAPPYKQYNTDGKWSTAPSGKLNTVVRDCHDIRVTAVLTPLCTSEAIPSLVACIREQ
jgi:hypothetical protein